jgi:DNA-binding CsgD family transcriptional regulator
MRTGDSTRFGSWVASQDAVKLLEITHACVSCRTEGEFRRLFPRVQEIAPFDRAIAIACRFGARGGLVAGRAVNVSYPEEFVREYVARDYFRLDPVMSDALATGRAQYCSAAGARPREIVALCTDFGLQDGYTLGSRTSASGEGSLFCLKSASLKPERRAAAVLELLAPHLQLAFSGLAGKPAGAGCVALSGREREIARWLAEGKSSWDISVILGISERTVNFHVCNLLRKLGATNRPQAVAIATRLRLLD